LLDYLPVLSLLISTASIILAYVSFKRTKVFQEQEYAPRLQLINEKVEAGSRGLPDRPALTYSAYIENRGLKPVEIAGIWLDYGANDDAQKRMKYVVVGEMYLGAGQKHEIQKAVSWSQIEEMNRRYGIEQAMFFLRVIYQVPNGNREESIRKLGGFDGTTTVFVAQYSDRLT
jgi:hypothetical protein